MLPALAVVDHIQRRTRRWTVERQDLTAARLDSGKTCSWAPAAPCPRPRDFRRPRWQPAAWHRRRSVDFAHGRRSRHERPV